MGNISYKPFVFAFNSNQTLCPRKSPVKKKKINKYLTYQVNE